MREPEPLEIPPWDRPQPPSSPMRRRRIGAFLSQEELAERVNVSRQTICALERGRSLPSVLLALAVARALNTTVEQLWGESQSAS
ncbi:MAG TPA: helix-turn-helix domain-containing protein [Gaiellaceae bacterium]|jgi:putative transcriptional regulator